MKKYLLLLPLVGLVMTGCNLKNQKNWKYLDTKKEDVTDVYFEETVADPYRWLENDTASEVKAWVEAENAVTDKYFKKIPFRDALNKHLTKIWDFPKYSTPSKKGERYFFSKNDGLQNQYVLYTQIGLAGEPEVLLDPNTFSNDGTVALAGTSLSKDGKYLAYQIAKGGSDWNEIYVMNVETKEKLADHIEWVKFSGAAWLGDGFFYSAYDKPKAGSELSGKNEYHKVYYHKLGDPQSKDELIYEDKNSPLRNFGIYTDEDQQYLFLNMSEGTSGNALYVKKAANKNVAFVPITKTTFDYDFDVIDVINNKILILTNYQAPNHHLVWVDPDNPSDEKNWKVFVPETKEVIDGVSVIGGKVIISYLRDAHNVALVYDFDGNFLHEIDFPGIGTVGGFTGEKNDTETFYAFTSYTYPTTIFRYDVTTNASEVYRKLDFEFNPENYETKQVFFNSKDGTSIPMFITHKKGITLDGQNPTLLYGYGGFDISLTPSFSISNLPFIDNGGVYVVVNLRGGGEYGKEWHDAGIQMKKQNVFDDFIAAAEWMIAQKYTNPEKLAILGGSNGGLLVGACMTQRPDLYKVAIPQVGVLDMLRYHKFTIGWAWAGDYGTSEDSKEMFNYLKGYSPLHNVKEGVNYPATLVTTADHDDRVVPAHSFKFIAELQAKDGGKNPVLVRIESKAGHGAGKPTSKIIEETSDRWAFIMYNLGMTPKF